jgi:hypothetical protein
MFTGGNIFLLHFCGVPGESDRFPQQINISKKIEFIQTPGRMSGEL